MTPAEIKQAFASIFAEIKKTQELISQELTYNRLLAEKRFRDFGENSQESGIIYRKTSGTS